MSGRTMIFTAFISWWSLILSWQCYVSGQRKSKRSRVGDRSPPRNCSVLWLLPDLLDRGGGSHLHRPWESTWIWPQWQCQLVNLWCFHNKLLLKAGNECRVEPAPGSASATQHNLPRSAPLSALSGHGHSHSHGPTTVSSVRWVLVLFISVRGPSIYDVTQFFHIFGPPPPLSTDVICTWPLI